ncbi:transposase [Sinorhizobium prairiense]|uniref:transposase n=1 Tax=unclassified Sinorhizobium TaxID=2613772 RepID=UPI0035C8A2BF
MGRVEILTGVERGRVWTDEDKLRILEEVEVSGSGVAEIARRHDILPQQIYTWRKKLGRDIRSPGGSGVTLLPVALFGKRNGSSRGSREGHSETAGKAVSHRGRLQRWPRLEGRCLDCAGNPQVLRFDHQPRNASDRRGNARPDRRTLRECHPRSAAETVFYKCFPGSNYPPAPETSPCPSSPASRARRRSAAPPAASRRASW